MYHMEILIVQLIISFHDSGLQKLTDVKWVSFPILF